MDRAVNQGLWLQESSKEGGGLGPNTRALGWGSGGGSKGFGAGAVVEGFGGGARGWGLQTLKRRSLALGWGSGGVQGLRCRGGRW